MVEHSGIWHPQSLRVVAARLSGSLKVFSWSLLAYVLPGCLGRAGIRVTRLCVASTVTGGEPATGLHAALVQCVGRGIWCFSLPPSDPVCCAKSILYRSDMCLFQYL